MILEQRAEIVAAFARNFCVPSRLPIEEWCNANVPLENDVSEKFNIELTPWFREPLRACADHICNEVFCVAAPGLGKTTVFMEAFVLWLACNNPQNLLLVSDNIVLLEQFLDSRLHPLINRCAALQPFLPRKSDRQKKLLILGNSMFLMARAANKSSAQQVSTPIQILDEAWLFERGLINFFRRRGHDRERRKLICVSQAGFQKTEFHDDVVAGDQYSYLWQCQSCGERQPFRLPIKFDGDKDANLKFEGGDGAEIDWKAVQASVRLECSFCHHAHPDTPGSRRALSSGAIWLKTADGEDPNRRVYTVPALARYQIPYYEFAKEFLKARRNWRLGARDDFIQYVQARCSVFWKETYEQQEVKLVKSSYLWRSYEDGITKAPGEVVRFMTIDRQKDTWWIIIRAWCDGGASRLLRFEHVLAESELRSLQLQYQVEDRYVFCDAAFEAPAAYQLAARWGWFCVQGSGEAGFQHPKKNARGTEWRMYSKIRETSIGSAKAKLILLSSDRLKDVMVALRDQQTVEWLIPADIPPAYLTGIQAEIKKATTDPKTKREVYRWTPVDENNHPFDLEYYQVAAALMAGVLRLD